MRKRGSIEELRTGYRVRIRNGDKISSSKLLKSRGEAEELLELIREELPDRPPRVSDHPLYKVWAAMIQRCCNPKSQFYSYYGGKGVKVCDRWRWSFDAFTEDMGERPEGFSLDRENGDGDYCPDNCRWADPYTQAQNREFSVKSSSGERYVYPVKYGFSVVVTRGGTRYHRFDKTVEGAITKRDNLLKELKDGQTLGT